MAAELGFAGVTRNSIDAVGDRDFVVETLAAAALTMTHLSRLAEELVWWSNPAFGFLRLADAWSTGSSMMPNKRNPDPAELVRGRTARVDGHLMAALTLLKGLPAATSATSRRTSRRSSTRCACWSRRCASWPGSWPRSTWTRRACGRPPPTGYTTATAVADALVELGVPFREAHHLVGSLVARAEAAGVELTGLADADIVAILGASPDVVAAGLAADAAVPGTLRAAAELDNALARPDVIGGTAPRRVHAELAAAAERLGLRG